MSWRWQINNNPRQIATLLALQQQQQQQQQLPVRWLHEYQNQLTQSQFFQQIRLQQQQQQQLHLQHNVQQHPQFQYPLQGRDPSIWADMTSSHTKQSVYSQAHTARRELYEDMLPARNIRTTQSDNRHNVMYNQARTQVLYPEQRNRRLLNEVHQARTALYDEYLPTRNVQQAIDNDYRCNGLYYKERFPYHDEKPNIFHPEKEYGRLLDEQSNEFRRRTWRSRTPFSTSERQHPYNRSLRARSVGPDQRRPRYRSKSVGPELGYQRNYDSDSRGKRNIGEDQLFFNHNSRKKHSSCSDYTEVGENRENGIRYGNSWNTGPNLCDENRLKIKQNAHSVMNQPKFRKREASISPAKDSSSVIDADNKRRNIFIPEKRKKIVHELSVTPNGDSASSRSHTSPHVLESQEGNGSFTGITRTVPNVSEETPSKSTSAKRDGNDGSTIRNWQLTPLENVALNRSHTPLSGITRTVLNVHPDRTHTHKVGERNHRLRSFREEEEEDEKTPEEEEEEEMDSGDDDDLERVGEEINSYKNVQRGRGVEARCVEHETKINMVQQSTDECVGEIECTKKCQSKFDGEAASQLQINVPEYNHNVPVGRSLLKWTSGLRCRMCHKFFLEFKVAEKHCQTVEHYNNYVKRITELQRALNVDPMDGAKALEVQQLFEDEPPSSIPPESSYLSEV